MKLLEKIFKKPSVKIWNMWEHKYWGDRIAWFNFDNRTIEGHLPYDLIGFEMIKVGDELRAKMKSGKIARFRITKVEMMPDPPDQFFADVKDIGYLGER